jgi:hypothetical protein
MIAPKVIFKLILVCAEPHVENLTNVWTPQDELEFGKAKIECSVLADTPCLGVFTKTLDGKYDKTCIKKSLFQYESYEVQELPPGFKN